MIEMCAILPCFPGVHRGSLSIKFLRPNRMSRMKEKDVIPAKAGIQASGSDNVGGLRCAWSPPYHLSLTRALSRGERGELLGEVGQADDGLRATR